MGGLPGVLIFSAQVATATTLHVGGAGPGNYTTIQAAVNAASPGDTVFVYGGIYLENVTVDKTLSLVGQSMGTTIIDGGGAISTIRVTADWVNITGFNVTGDGLFGIDYLSTQHGRVVGNRVADVSTGIAFRAVSVGVTITGNNISGTGVGVSVGGASDATITGNTFSEGRVGSSGSGGIEVSGTNVTITANSFTSGGVTIGGSPSDLSSTIITPDNSVNGKPIYYYKDCSGLTVDSVPVGQLLVANCTDVRVSNLQIENAGIWMAYVDRVNISGNRVSNHSYGDAIALFRSSNVSIAANEVSSSGYGTGVGGISLIEVTTAVLTANNLTRNAGGINLRSSFGVAIMANRFSHDQISDIFLMNSGNLLIADNRHDPAADYAVRVQDSGSITITRSAFDSGSFWGKVGLRNSVSVSVHHNNFVLDTGMGQADDDRGPENAWDDGYPSGGNYWDDHTAVDQFSGPNQDLPGSDGIGDTPYVIDADSMDRYPLMNPPDLTPPTVSITSPVNGQWIATPSQVVAGTASDAGGSGLDRVEVSCDGGVSYSLATATASWAHMCVRLRDGATSIVARAFDNVSLESVPDTISVNVDLTPPSVTISVPEDGSMAMGQPITVSGGAADTGIGLDRVDVSCDGGATWTVATGTTSWIAECPLIVGLNALRARAFDLLGWASPDDFVTITYAPNDVSAPLLVSPADAAWTRAVAPALAWSFQDPDSGDIQAGFRVEIAGDAAFGLVDQSSGDVVSLAQSWTPAPLADGCWYWRVRTLDSAGAWSSFGAPWQVCVDTLGPATSLTVAGRTRVSDGTTYATSSALVSLAAMDGGIGADFTVFRVLDRFAWSPWTQYAASFALPAPDGVKYIEFRSVDALGNAEATNTASIVLDDSPPVTEIKPAVEPYRKETNFILVSLDAGSGVARTEYSIDGGGWIEYAGPLTFSAGEHAIVYRSVDFLGNLEPEQTLSIEIMEPLPLSGREGYAWLLFPWVVIVIVGALCLLELLRSRLFFPFVILWARLRREDIMDQRNRWLLHGYLATNAGAHFSAIRADLGMAVGTLAYHVWVLESEGMIKSWKDGRFRRYALNGYRVEDRQPRVTDIELLLLRALQRTPGMRQRELAEEAGVTQPTISYHIGRMAKMGIVQVERRGLRKHYSPNLEAIRREARRRRAAGAYLAGTSKDTR